jgi:hypothetical protein
MRDRRDKLAHHYLCESFFEQFFATLNHEISGLFDYTAKEEAAELAIRLGLKNERETKHTRTVIALFELFCDMYADVEGGLYGLTGLTALIISGIRYGGDKQVSRPDTSVRLQYFSPPVPLIVHTAPPPLRRSGGHAIPISAATRVDI